MQPWKILTKLLLITILALSASGVVSAKVASGPQNLSPGLHQSETVFNPLTQLAKIDFSTTLTPGSPVVAKGTPQVLKNKARGDAFRDEIADLMKKEGRDVQTEVTKKTPFGRRVIDVEVSKDGKVLGGIETKTGKSRYLPSQRAKDEWLRQNGYPVNVVRDP